VALAIAAGSHPKQETDFCGEAEPFQELSHEKRKALVVVRNGEALDEVIDGDSDANGKKREALHEEVGLKAGISCKKFISSVSAKHGFYFSGCQTGEEPSWNEGGIPERFIQTAVDGGQSLRNIFWGEGLVMVFRANLTGDHFGEGEFIVGGLLKADREGVQLLFSQRGGEGSDGTRIDPTTQKDADFHIASKLIADRFPEKFAGGLGRLIKGACSDGIILDW